MDDKKRQILNDAAPDLLEAAIAAIEELNIQVDFNKKMFNVTSATAQYVLDLLVVAVAKANGVLK